MNILKVIVDELPVSCFACDWSDFGERNRLECQFDKTRNVDMFCKGRHDACPLMVDSEVARLREDNERLRERGARKRGKTEKLSKDENKYLKSLELHRKYVREAGVALGLPEGIYLSHDLSKFWPEEFFAYADWFYGKKSDPEAYDRAWLHHLHNNPHHWQYWVMPPEFNPDGDHDNGCLEMPEEYVLEMIADWLGANKAYQGTWDMTPWLKENFGKIRMHQKSKDFLVKKLRELGYGAVLDEVEK